jgi:hypothetical protein
MDILNQLEVAVENLILQKQSIERDYSLLLQEKAAWSQERIQLVGEIDRILQRIESLSQEDS